MLSSGLRSLLRVTYAPLHDTVARLEISGRHRVLYLDSDSPAEDHCWAMFEVLSVLTHGPTTARWAVPGRCLHLVSD
jgi:hypothetical protein